jgi:hypothetical protein
MKRGRIGVNTIPIDRSTMFGVIMDAFVLINFPSESQYKRYKALSLPIRYHITISILGGLYGLKNGTKSDIVRYTGKNSDTINKNVDILFNHGYVVKVPRLRLLKPMNKHTVDTAYQLSEKGEKFLVEYVNSCIG